MKRLIHLFALVALLTLAIGLQSVQPAEAKVSNRNSAISIAPTLLARYDPTGLQNSDSTDLAPSITSPAVNVSTLHNAGPGDASTNTDVRPVRAGTGPLDLVNGYYIEFTLTPVNPALSIKLSSINYNYLSYCSGSSFTISLLTSTDNYTSIVDTKQVAGSTAGLLTFDASSVTPIAGPIQVRFYLYGLTGGCDYGLGLEDWADIVSSARNPSSTGLSVYGYVVAAQTASFASSGTYDGQVIEKTENFNNGGTANSFGGFLAAGDTALDQQVLSVLHFDTSSLPDNAVVIDVRLEIKQYQVAGTNPLNTFGPLYVDIASPYFGAEPSLKPTDFLASAGTSDSGYFNTTSYPGNWFDAGLRSSAYPYLNLTGTTQLRVHFSLDDNDNLKADQFRFYSGNATAAYRPVLVIQYVLIVCGPVSASESINTTCAAPIP
jgi:hypothetical protein